ncbi:hypothetical protein F7Q99_36110 [Streptomyces kaniharaensis]|uniref:Uncharacterized protein n=1 Tax=Streptomyces kaniharaensis TaxID=212423 RepID=A0A6N7L3T5_9ACTN|nr:hypothetical protein [Streptomyces kaniharaensis]MQS17467.1 hypothetical protein [Streptomyces kaniharaensis]
MNPRARKARATVRNRIRARHLAETAQERPRSLGTYALIAGATGYLAERFSDALRSVAKRLIKTRPELAGEPGVTHRTLSTGPTTEEVPTTRYTRHQVAEIATAYRPVKAEFRALRASLLASLASA